MRSLSDLQLLLDSETSVQIFFSLKVGGVDQLKPPNNFPTPLFVYTVKEMSILWQMYGGNDFQTNKRNKRCGRLVLQRSKI